MWCLVFVDFKMLVKSYEVAVSKQLKNLSNHCEDDLGNFLALLRIEKFIKKLPEKVTTSFQGNVSVGCERTLEIRN